MNSKERYEKIRRAEQIEEELWSDPRTPLPPEGAVSSYLKYADDAVLTRELEALELRYQVEMSRRFEEVMRDRMEVKMVRSGIKDRAIADLRIKFWSESPREMEIGSAPADWIEALKERFAPAWLLEMWPVEYYRFFVTTRMVYTDLPPGIEGQRHRVFVQPGKSKTRLG